MRGSTLIVFENKDRSLSVRICKSGFPYPSKICGFQRPALSVNSSGGTCLSTDVFILLQKITFVKNIKTLFRQKYLPFLPFDCIISLI